MATPPKAAPGVSEEQLAKLLGCSDRNIRDLAKRQLVVKVAPGRYDLGRSVQTYVKHLRDQAAGHRSGEDDLVVERARLTRLQAEEIEVRLAVRRGELIAIDEVSPALERIVRAVQLSLLAVATKAAGRLPHLSRHDVGVVDALIRESLADAAVEKLQGAVETARKAAKRKA
ncbi:MAG: hypothetical protein J0I54_20625 [Bosea sp.]|uniref:hypothetical protein n=1 Tax=unclassified Bosea (in: a-proteobacteria) TaxID=2653178 RepID=UPI00095A318F|nr:MULTISPECIES: hypothetical protein [unclassified Bosea (in: a-proteobacteria)]MBN9459045.1 hypothetical protein [Bosea sp. (in: a-proteobacteria)]OJV06213.1 MAG: hypothetical protein BGO20_08125 [Bosea sp. 67-29]